MKYLKLYENLDPFDEDNWDEEEQQPTIVGKNFYCVHRKLHGLDINKFNCTRYSKYHEYYAFSKIGSRIEDMILFKKDVHIITDISQLGNKYNVYLVDYGNHDLFISVVDKVFDKYKEQKTRQFDHDIEQLNRQKNFLNNRSIFDQFGDKLTENLDKLDDEFEEDFEEDFDHDIDPNKEYYIYMNYKGNKFIKFSIFEKVKYIKRYGATHYIDIDTNESHFLNNSGIPFKYRLIKITKNEQKLKRESVVATLDLMDKFEIIDNDGKYNIKLSYKNIIDRVIDIFDIKKG